MSLERGVSGEGSRQPEVVLEEDAVHALGRGRGPGGRAAGRRAKDVLAPNGVGEL